MSIGVAPIRSIVLGLAPMARAPSITRGRADSRLDVLPMDPMEPQAQQRGTTQRLEDMGDRRRCRDGTAVEPLRVDTTLGPVPTEPRRKATMHTHSGATQLRFAAIN